MYHPHNLTTFGRQTPQAHEPVLLLRHFIVGGVSAKSALLAYEQRLERQLRQPGVRWGRYLENACGPAEKGFGDSNDMPDFGRPAELRRAQRRRITMRSGDIAGNTGTREPTSHRLGSDRSHSVCDRFQPKKLPEFIDPP